MCGIAGGAWFDEAGAISDVELHAMTVVLAHRGPDAQGCKLRESTTDGARGGAALGHRRLSIIDLGGGAQPMADEAGTIWTAFNGEIYNYRELREELRGRGHRFRTDSDTEVLIEAYKAFGIDCVRHFRGMFAFAIWDGRRLFLARDRMGQKPLLYRIEQNRLLFASELKSLRQIGSASGNIDPAAVDDYLTYQYVPTNRCIFEGIQKLPPGHSLIYEAGGITLHRYWWPPYGTKVDKSWLTIDPEETPRWKPERWKTELRARLTEAVRLRMRSDVPLGAFLSGGIDSTIICGLMQQTATRPVHTFSIGFPEAAYDERHYARAAAEHLGTLHEDRLVDPAAMALLPRLAWHYDEPFADSSAIPTTILSEWTREHVTVALTGDGGDELFCGYNRYEAVRLAGVLERLPRPVRAILGAQIWQRMPARTEYRSFRRRLKRFLSGLAVAPERRYLKWVGIFDDTLRKSLYTDDFLERLNGHDSFGFLEEAYTACPDRDFVTRTTCADILTYLPCDILTKVDIASMSVGLEARSPFMDHTVVELAALMPIELKLGRPGGKRILVETFADLLPASIKIRGKMGFGVPLDHWFRGELQPLLRRVLLSDRMFARNIFRYDSLEELIEQHTAREYDHSYRLWALLMFELWMRTHVDQVTPQEPIADLLEDRAVVG